VPEQQIQSDTTRAVASLPGMEIEVVHRLLPDAQAEQISIHLQAVPSFEAFGNFLGAANPFAFWAQAAQMAWLPWLGMAQALLPSQHIASPAPRSEAKSET
jgi:hypothetical protein